MNDERVRLEQVKIASPCPASWADMVGDDRTRFCSICSRNVYNLSAMTRADAASLVVDKRGKLCALLYVKRDGTVMTSDCPVGRSTIRKRMLKRIVTCAVALSAFVGLEEFLRFNLKLNQTVNEEVRPADRQQIESEKEELIGSLGYISD